MKGNYLAYILIALLFSSSIVNAQTSNTRFHRAVSNSLPADFELDIPHLREHIYNGIPDNLKEEGRSDRSCFRFADQSAHFVSRVTSSGYIYSDWPELEEYLNKILQKVMPDELKDDSLIHAYVIKDGSSNAFMTPAGIFYMHIGLFAEVYDEASIAGIMAHELAHYYKRHPLKRFMLAEKGEFRQGIFFENKNLSKFSIANEIQSDSLAMHWLNQSGYKVEGLREFFLASERQYKKWVKRSSRYWEYEANTHPLSSDRIKAIDKFIKNNDAYKGENFLVSESEFKKFKEEAKPEILNNFLTNFSYSNCIETAFNFHIYDPDNTVYIWYLMESIRRKCYLNIEMWDKNFITHRYYKGVEQEGSGEKEQITAHLFEKFDLEIMGLKPTEVINMKARFYWADKPRFKTHEQAYNFFYSVSKQLGEPECILSNALSFVDNDSVRNALLTEYIALPNALYKEYAQNLLDGSIFDDLPDKKLIVLSYSEVMVRQGYDDILIRPLKTDKGDIMEDLIKNSTDNYMDRTQMYLPNLKKDRLNDFHILAELNIFSGIRTFA
ncbi:MAG: M48 family metallopeptidase, partial [Bacteroidia bacterium]|nr:M48 family metallopeptidase [Bacteroidia bacterium]